jgi:hypothetical protein
MNSIFIWVLFVVSLCVLLFVLAVIFVWIKVTCKYNRGLCLRYISFANIRRVLRYSLRIDKMNKRSDSFAYSENMLGGFDTSSNGNSSSQVYPLKYNYKNVPMLDSERIPGLTFKSGSKLLNSNTTSAMEIFAAIFVAVGAVAGTIALFMFFFNLPYLSLYKSKSLNPRLKIK